MYVHNKVRNTAGGFAFGIPRMVVSLGCITWLGIHLPASAQRYWFTSQDMHLHLTFLRRKYVDLPCKTPLKKKTRLRRVYENLFRLQNTLYARPLTWPVNLAISLGFTVDVKCTAFS